MELLEKSLTVISEDLASFLCDMILYLMGSEDILFLRSSIIWRKSYTEVAFYNVRLVIYVRIQTIELENSSTYINHHHMCAFIFCEPQLINKFI